MGSKFLFGAASSLMSLASVNAQPLHFSYHFTVQADAQSNTVVGEADDEPISRNAAWSTLDCISNDECKLAPADAGADASVLPSTMMGRQAMRYERPSVTTGARCG